MKTSILMAAVCVLSLSLCGSASAQAPVLGQAYQIPDGYTGYPAGTVITYGGYNYVINSDATMVLADQAADSSQPADDQGAGQAYQIPDGYAGYAAGTVICYGGANYTICSNGTMVLANQAVDTTSAMGDQSSGQLYQIPDGYGGYAAGTVITYGGSNYTIGLSGTMVLHNKSTYSSNYVRPGGGSRPAMNGSYLANNVRPGAGYRPLQGGYRPTQGGYRPTQSGYRPTQGGYRLPMNGPRLGGVRYQSVVRRRR